MAPSLRSTILALFLAALTFAPHTLSAQPSGAGGSSSTGTQPSGNGNTPDQAGVKTDEQIIRESGVPETIKPNSTLKVYGATIEVDDNPHWTVWNGGIRIVSKFHYDNLTLTVDVRKNPDGSTSVNRMTQNETGNVTHQGSYTLTTNGPWTIKKNPDGGEIWEMQQQGVSGYIVFFPPDANGIQIYTAMKIVDQPDGPPNVEETVRGV